AICLNGMRYAPNDIALGVLSSYFDKELEYPDFTKKLAELTEAQLNRCAGKYTSSNFPLDISVVIKQGVMFAEAKGQTAFPLEAHSEAVFRFDPAGILMEFKPSADGKTMTGFKLTQMGASYDFLKE
ncbi:MAG: peptidase, partial [Bacteroidia bacterium]